MIKKLISQRNRSSQELQMLSNSNKYVVKHSRKFGGLIHYGLDKAIKFVKYLLAKMRAFKTLIERTGQCFIFKEGGICQHM